MRRARIAAGGARAACGAPPRVRQPPPAAGGWATTPAKFTERRIANEWPFHLRFDLRTAVPQRRMPLNTHPWNATRLKKTTRRRTCALARIFSCSL